jgi:hypothetical protein
MKKNLFIALLATLFITACHKKDDPANPQPIDSYGSLKISFKNIVNNQTLALGFGKYENENGDTFSVTMYKYYISNITLTDENGNVYAEPNSYHLVNEEKPASKVITIPNMLAAKYKSISFMIGVDSLHNVSGAQSGDLDPGNLMFWDWNTGYIMAKIEGTSPQAGSVDKKITFHMGGFSGAYSVLKNVTLNLPQSAEVSDAKTPVINITSDLAAWFSSPNKISFAQTYGVAAPGRDAKAISENYANMFAIESVDNQ